MFYHVKEASAPVISGSVHPQEASWSLITTPGCRRVRALCDPGYQLRVAVVVWEAHRITEEYHSEGMHARGLYPNHAQLVITQVLGLEPR